MRIDPFLYPMLYDPTRIKPASATLEPRRIVEPTDEPITLADAKEHVRVTDDDQDFYIQGLITASRIWCENKIDRSFITSTWQVTTDQFPDNAGPINLPRPNLIAISSIQYIDTGQTLQTIDPSRYAVDAASQPGRIFPAYTLIWPATLLFANSVIITYTAGYGDSADDVPLTIKHAMKMYMQKLFDTVRGGGDIKMDAASDSAIESLLDAERWTLK